MDNNNLEQGGFSFTYSAKEQSELKKIREKYTPPTDRTQMQTEATSPPSATTQLRTEKTRER